MIKIITKENCGQCYGTKAYLEAKGIPYEEHKAEDNPNFIEEAKKRGAKSLPIVIVDDELWTGFDLGRLWAVSTK